MKKYLVLALLLVPAVASAHDHQIGGNKSVTNIQAASQGSVGLQGVSGSGAVLGGLAVTGGTQSVNSNGSAGASFKNNTAQTWHNGTVTSTGINGSAALGLAGAGTATQFGGTSDDQGIATYKMKSVSVKLH